MGTISSAASAIIVLFLGLACLSLRDWSLTDLTRLEKLICLLMILFFSASVISFFNSDDLQKSLARLERLLRIVAFVPIFLYVRKTRIQLVKPLTYGFIVAGYALFVASIFTAEGGRANGAYNSILFGDFAALSSVLLLALALRDKQSLFVRLITLGSLALALISLIDSGTRGAWAGFVVAALVLLSLKIFERSCHPTSLKSLVLPLILTTVILSLSPLSVKIQSGLAAATHELSGYVSGSNPHTSLGYRFQMWEAATKMWLKNPFIGSGLGDYSHDLAAMMKSGETKITEHFGEGHSLFFEFLATTGFIGFALCITSLFVLPALVAARAIKNCGDTHRVSYLLIATVISFFMFGLTQNWLARSSITSTYLLLLAILIALIGQARQQSTSNKCTCE